MLPLQEISDRIEIQDLMTRYSFAIDEQDFDALDRVFTPDAVIDYHELGGSVGNLAETKAFLAKALPRFPRYQHANIATKLAITGDEATASTILFNPMVANVDGREQVFFIGLWYDDKLRRMADGWRITHRYERASWNYNTPAGMVP